MLNAIKNLVSKKQEVVQIHEFISLQGAAYRVFKSHMDTVCKDEHLSALEGGLLSLLLDVPDGKRYNHIAQELAVEPPFVTELVTKLLKKKCIEVRNDPRDKRAKIILLTKNGEEITEKIRTKSQSVLAGIFQSLSKEELSTYKKILDVISASRPIG